MENLEIKPSKNTPFVHFKKNGDMTIEGRSYPSETISFFQPLFEWVNNFKEKNINFKIKLEYFNTSSCKQLLSLLRLILDSKKDGNINVIWFYEEHDLDLLEIGQHMESILDKQFEYKKYSQRINRDYF